MSSDRYPCLCCGFKTLSEAPPGTFAVCPVCFWEDDDVQARDPSFAGGANKISLDEARANFRSFGASSDLNELEKEVLEKLLAGEHPVLQRLRQQLGNLMVAKRAQTGVGFYTMFAVAGEGKSATVGRPSLRFGDIVASIKGLRYGAGFLLFVDGGVIKMLEGYSYEEA